MLGRCLTTLLALIWIGSVAADPYRPGDVTVVVFERGEPAEGLGVRLDGSSATTDGSGVADLTVAPGRRQLVVDRDGTTFARIPVNLGDGQSAEVSVNLAGLGREARSQVRVFDAGAGDGRLAGVVRDSRGAPLPGATVAVEALGAAAETGQDGTFEIGVPRGIYALTITHPDVPEQRLSGVRALASLEGDLEIAMSGAEPGASSGGTIEEMVVVGRYVPDTTIALERNSESVLDVISAEEISLFGDTTAAEALLRVTGVTVQNDIAFVRGLGDRYSTTFFNGAELPSPDPTRRAIGLEIFPAELISGITVQKTYTADLPADFSGGAVRLQTRTIPDELTGTFAASTGTNSRSSFQDAFTHRGGDTDFLGIDDGDRDIPGIAGNLTDGGALPLAQLSSADNQAISQALADEFAWNLRGFELPADLDVDFSLSNRFRAGESDIGISFAGLYDSSWRYVDELRAEVLADARGAEFVGESSRLERTENDIRLGGIFNVAAELGYNHTLNFTSLLSRESLKGTFLEQGFNRSDDRDFRRVVLEFTESQLFTNQVSGEHLFPGLGDFQVNWQVAYSDAQRDEPGTREYTYSRGAGSDNAFRLATGPGEAGLPPLLSWEHLDEDTVDASLELMRPVTLRGGDITGDIIVGGRLTEREREFDTVRWRFALAPGAGAGNPLFFPSLAFPSVEMILTPSRLGPNGFRLVNASTALAGGSNADNYDGTHDIYAGYLLGDFDIGSLFRVQAGVRVESSELAVATDAIVGGATRIGEIDETDYLPSLNVSWFISEQSQLRFAASRTLNRPQFRELSPTPYRDPETRFESVGNPNLEQSTVTSFDLRYERYWSRDAGVSLAAFYKDLDDPIEVVTIGGGSDDRGVRSFANAEKAELYGVELDGRYTLEAFEGVAGFFRDMYITGNVAWIESEVTVGETVLGVGTNNRRELQGQSPWVVNLGLGYSNVARGTDAVLAFNMFGERIVEAGVNGVPDAEEQPRAVLDFNLKQVFFDNWVVGLKLRNLLDSRFEVEQGSEVQRSYKIGRGASLSVSFEF